MEFNPLSLFSGKARRFAYGGGNAIKGRSKQEMVKEIGQVLIITWLDGHVTKKRNSNWSDFIDMREQYSNNPKVRDTEVQYDL